MKILVPIKRVIDTEVRVKVRSDGRGVITDGMNWVVNPFDEIAVEESLRIKEKQGGDAGSEVVVVSVGPKDAAQQIRSALAMGADRGVLVEGADEDLDAGAVAQVLAKVVEREKPDLVVMGKQAPDGDANQVGQMLAELLGWPMATFASKVELQGAPASAARVTREVDGGLETIEVDLPAVITADLRLNEPRYASLPGIMKAKKKKIDEAKMADFGVQAKSRQKLLAMAAPPKRKAGAKVADVDDLLNKLRNEAKVI
ncbi:MAG TPA: electron transfer flavoprotein subunit beta/FixA family protein [Myxococcota bacterium]|nr:electron transfer flavoprotein subunit beta/FixA family protein [Myxococcota bacterium]